MSSSIKEKFGVKFFPIFLLKNLESCLTRYFYKAHELENFLEEDIDVIIGGTYFVAGSPPTTSKSLNRNKY